MPRKLTLACLLGLFFGLFAWGQTAPATPDPQNPPQAEPSKQPPSDDDNLPEEDESLKPKIYPFNPLEADRSIKVGSFYMHQGTPRGYRAAAARFIEATKYNPQSEEAFFRLGEAEEKLKHKDKAKAAFGRAVQIAPGSKYGKDAKRKLQPLG